MKTFRQNYSFKVEPKSYNLDLLDVCFDQAQTFFDMGCGRGDWAGFLIDRYGLKFDCFDVDKSNEQIAKDRFAEYLVAEEADSQHFDVVFVSFVTEFVPPEEMHEFVNQIRSKLKPDGKVYLSSAFYAPFSLKWLIYRILGIGNPQQYFLRNKYIRNFMTQKEVLSYFIGAGFKVVTSTRGSLAPRLPRLLDRVARALIPFPLFYDTAYFILEIDNAF